MMGDIALALSQWLDAGGRLVGQVWVTPLANGGYQLCHEEDVDHFQSGAVEMEVFNHSREARRLATYDDAGSYRPLKTAANLRHGWVLYVTGVETLCEALDFFYPTVLGVWTAGERLRVTSLRETLERQSGMYAVTKQISDDAAQAVIDRLCRSGAGCLKTILWDIHPGLPANNKVFMKTKQGSLPFLCNEGCNLLVAAMRDEVKKK